MLLHSDEYGVFSQRFSFELPAVVNFVGGGGKTTLILSLLEEYAEICSILYTTTTRIHPPPLKGNLATLASDNSTVLKKLVDNVGAQFHDRRCRLVVTRPEIVPGKLGGVARDFALSIDREFFPLILNEADGARGMSLKMPRDREPVLMDGANYLVPVIGLDCINRPAGAETIFRWDLTSRKMSFKDDTLLTPDLAAEVLMHKDGVCRDWKQGMKIIPFINKADKRTDDSLAVDLSRALLQNRDFPVDRVVWGSLHARRADVLSAPLQ